MSSGGKRLGAGRKRVIQHVEEGQCYCADCRLRRRQANPRSKFYQGGIPARREKVKEGRDGIGRAEADRKIPDLNGIPEAVMDNPFAGVTQGIPRDTVLPSHEEAMKILERERPGVAALLKKAKPQMPEGLTLSEKTAWLRKHGQ